MSGHNGVAEHDAQGFRTGRVHRALRKPTAKRNRSQYRTRCGQVIRRGLPLAVIPPSSACLHCYPNERSQP